MLLNDKQKEIINKINNQNKKVRKEFLQNKN